jgi:hypothetical protein
MAVDGGLAVDNEGSLQIDGLTSELPSSYLYGPNGWVGVGAGLSINAEGNLQVSAAPCDLPPFGCNISVNPYCVQNFNSLTGGLNANFLLPVNYTGGTTVLAQANRNYNGNVTGGSGTGGTFSLDRGSTGAISSVSLDDGSNYEDGDTITIPAALIGDTVDVEIQLTYDNGMGVLGAWQDCTSLTSFPLLNTSSGTNFLFAWFGCTSLTSFPTLDVSSGTNFTSAWTNCTSLTSFPTLDVSSGTNFLFAWFGCSSLTSFPLLDVSNGTNFLFTWKYCPDLLSFPQLDVSSGTNFLFTWAFCSSLTTFPLLDVSNGTDFTGAWYNCSSLTTFPLLDVSSGTNFYGAWAGCTSLTSFPANMFDSCSATTFDQAWTNCALNQTSVDNILVSIDTAGQSNGTLGINGGTSAAPSATGLVAKASLQAKGWTVTTN